MRNLICALLAGTIAIPIACSGSSESGKRDGGGTGGVPVTGGNGGGGSPSLGGGPNLGGGGASTGGSTSATGGAGPANGGSASGSAGDASGDGGGSGEDTGGAGPNGGVAGMAGAGTGGVAGQGGAGASGAGSGGAGAGSGGAGAGGMGGALAGRGGKGGSGGVIECPTIAELFPASGTLGSLDGRLFEAPCNLADSNSEQCPAVGSRTGGGPITGCMNNRLVLTQDYVVGGTPGATYQATLHFYGIVEPKFYGVYDIARDAGDTNPENLNTGATPPPFAVGTPGRTFVESDYSSYELHVLDDALQEVGLYYLNSVNPVSHTTYVLNYERTIPVVGGGRVRAYYGDRNCRMSRNCGATFTDIQSCVANVRTVDISAANPQPTTLNQPSLGVNNAAAGQWLLIDVTRVACP